MTIAETRYERFNQIAAMDYMTHGRIILTRSEIWAMVDAEIPYN